MNKKELQKQEDLQEFAEVSGLKKRSQYYKHSPGNVSILNDYYMEPRKRNKFFCFIEDWNPPKVAEQAEKLVASLNQKFNAVLEGQKWQTQITISSTIAKSKIFKSVDKSLAKASCKVVKKFLKDKKAKAAKAALQKKKINMGGI